MYFTIFKKELRGSLYTWKGMLWILISALLFSVTSYLLLTNKELSLLDQTELLWLFAKVIIGVGLLVVTIDASSSIASEFEKETVESLFVSPLQLKDFVLGKMLASFILWLCVFVVALPYILVTAAGTNLVLPFIGHVLLLGSIGVLGFIFFIYAIALLFRSSKNTLTTALVVLLGLAMPALFSSTLKNDLVSQLFAHINPLDNIFSSLDYVLVDYKTAIFDNVQYLLPLLGFLVLSGGFLIFAMKRFEQRGIISQE